VAAKVETTAGTAETLTAGHNIPRIADVRWTPNILSVERNLNRSSLTPYPNLVPGQTTGELAFTVELGGNSSMATGSGTFNPPRFDALLRGCGLEQVAVKMFTIGAVTSGPFRHGEAVTQASDSAAAGVIVGDCYNGTTRVFSTVASGTFSVGTAPLTGGTSGATATVSAISSDTYIGYRLVSDPDSQETITIASYLDGKIAKLHGAMGTCEFGMEHGNPVRMAFTFQGVHTSYTDGSLLTGASLQEGQYRPAAFFSNSTTLSLTDGTDQYGSGVSNAAGPLSTMTLALGNEVRTRWPHRAGSITRSFPTAPPLDPSTPTNWQTPPTTGCHRTRQGPPAACD